MNLLMIGLAIFCLGAQSKTSIGERILNERLESFVESMETRMEEELEKGIALLPILQDNEIYRFVLSLVWQKKDCSPERLREAWKVLHCESYSSVTLGPINTSLGIIS